MAIKPLGHRLLVKPEKLEETDEKIKSALTNIPGFKIEVSEREQASVDQGFIIDIGSTCWLEYGNGEPWAAIGDKVVYSRYSGKIVKDADTQEDYIILNDEDIIAKL